MHKDIILLHALSCTMLISMTHGFISYIWLIAAVCACVRCFSVKEDQ